MPDPRAVIVSCEHGGNSVPSRYAALFKDKKRLLENHRGYDFGALELAIKISESLGCPIYFSTVTRLLVDLNRSPRNHRKFSEVVRPLDPKEKGFILERYYWPYREEVQSGVKRFVSRGSVLHLSIHSFTPVLKGVKRSADIGLLYDPVRKAESKFCEKWRRAILSTDGSIRVRRNYPYRGVSDGMTSYLRKFFPERVYWGIELEVNQKYLRGERRLWNTLTRSIVDSLITTLGTIRDPR